MPLSRALMEYICMQSLRRMNGLPMQFNFQLNANGQLPVLPNNAPLPNLFPALSMGLAEAARHLLTQMQSANPPVEQRQPAQQPEENQRNEQAEPVNLCIRDVMSQNSLRIDLPNRSGSDEEMSTPSQYSGTNYTFDYAALLQNPIITQAVNALNITNNTIPQPSTSHQPYDIMNSSANLCSSTPVRFPIKQRFNKKKDSMMRREEQRSFRLSLRETQPRLIRRRRVGWRGTVTCAACKEKFSGMEELNTHFVSVHMELLRTEYEKSLQPGAKTSKRLFQAQLERLRLEKAMISDTMEDPDSEPHQSESLQEMSKSSSSYQSPGQQQSPNATEDLSMVPSTSWTNMPQRPPEPQRNNLSTPKTYACPACPYVAKWPTELQKHVMVHSPVRPFQCLVCSTNYKWEWDLGRHFGNAHPNMMNPYKSQRVPKHSSTQEISNNADANSQEEME